MEVFVHRSPNVHLCCLAFPRKTSALNLSKSLGAAQHGDDAHHASNRKDLKQVPAGIIHEKHTLHGHDGAKEGNMRQGRGAESLGQVVEVGAEQKPLPKKKNNCQHQQEHCTYLQVDNEHKNSR